MRYEIWREGYLATGERDEAQYMGSAEGRTFKAACTTFFATRSYGDNFDRSSMRYWGCRLFDNEDDARRSFG